MPKSKEQARAFDPKLDLYGTMAHYVAEKLHIRPSEILDEWYVPELIVAFGNIANKEAQKSFAEWKDLDAKQRMKYPRPPEYQVYFMGEL